MEITYRENKLHTKSTMFWHAPLNTKSVWIAATAKVIRNKCNLIYKSLISSLRLIYIGQPLALKIRHLAFTSRYLPEHLLIINSLVHWRKYLHYAVKHAFRHRSLNKPYFRIVKVTGWCIFIIFKLGSYFFLAVLSSQENWGDSREISHISLAPWIPPTCTNSPMISMLSQAARLLQRVNLH